MELKEFYEENGGDYQDVLERLPNENLIKKFLLKFLDDKTFETLKTGIDARDYQKVFASSHTLKGVAANLGLESLRQEASDLTELTRNGVEDGEIVRKAFEKVEDCYQKVTTEIQQIKEC